jgi:16S rRNA (guanine527-N7)-methyltransferase
LVEAPPPGARGSGELLDRWLQAVVATTGLTAHRDERSARRMLLDDALRAVDLVRAQPGSVVDVGSGGGSPGIPLAWALPDREVTLLEAERRKCAFLEQWCQSLPNLRVTWGRAESHPLGQFGVATAKALAAPPVALEWCLPLVSTGGAVVLWTGESASLQALARAAELLGGGVESFHEGLVLVRKAGPTPAGFPRRAGAARKRPLA